MLIQPESPAPAPAAVSDTSPKLRQLLRKRLRQLLRITLGMAGCLVLAAAAFAIWWLTSLNGLPDIGDPFDVAAFRAFSVPDAQNAFTFLRRAEEKLTPSPASVALAWSQADAQSRQWVEANRQAIDLFQQGAEQSDAANPAGESLVNGQRLVLLVLLEGDRRQERGDTAGAWDCYRAVLRMTTHIRRRGSLHHRFDVNVYFDRWLQQRLTIWAAGPKTTTPQLHAALDEVLKCEPRPEWDAFAIKIGYLELLRSLERPIHPVTRQEIEGEYTHHLGDMQLSPDMIGHVDAARRFLSREPERSRRDLRLICANWLAHVETPELPPRRPAVRASLYLVTSTNPVRKGAVILPLYPVGTDAPAGARSLPPQEVASWLVATIDAKRRILVANRYGWPWPPDRLQDRRAHSALVLMLAAEIYHRERGSPPPSDEALVGTYLKSLPDDGSSDLDDGTAPTAGEPSAYEVYAVRYARELDVPVSELVEGAEPGRKLDIAMIFWVLKGPAGRTVLVDAGFHRARLLRRKGIADYTRPDKALGRLGIRPEEVTDVIVTHMHWDHADGIDLFPKAQVWIQKDEFNYYTREAKQQRGHDGNDDLDEVSAIVKLNTRGRVRLVDGDAREILPGVTVYTGGRHTFASQYVGVNTKAGRVVIASDNLYLYENLDKHVPITQTFDAKSNLAAQDRMKRLATSPRLIVPGHDPEVFVRFPKPGNGVARVE
jgi:glyoxylase-like metal-dependent hydrolase (beta-lactamase superfamily II)